MYLWHVPALPPAAPGRLAVDELGRVHQYDATMAAWQRREFVVKEVASIFMNCASLPATQEPWYRIVCPGIVGSSIPNTWDQFFRRSLVEAQLVGAAYPDGGPRFYQADMTEVELLTWLRSVIPQSGGVYECNVQVRVHDVFDPQIRCDQAMGVNLLYSQARGGKSYGHRLYGRRRDGLPSWHETTPDFDGGFFADALKPFGTACLQEFYSITPATDDNGICWFPVATRNLYGGLRAGIAIPSKSRPSYDVVAGTYSTVDTGFTVGAPKLLVLSDNPVPNFRQFQEMVTLRGAQWIGNGYPCMVVYPLTAGNLRAFFLKPYGIDYASLRIAPGTQTPLANMRIRARRVFPRGMSDSYADVPTEYTPQINGFRFLVRSTMPSFWGHGVDDDRVPNYVRLHLYDPDTGLRSDEFDSEIEIVRRRRNISIAPLLVRKQRRQ